MGLFGRKSSKTPKPPAAAGLKRGDSHGSVASSSSSRSARSARSASVRSVGSEKKKRPSLVPRLAAQFDKPNFGGTGNAADKADGRVSEGTAEKTPVSPLTSRVTAMGQPKAPSGQVSAQLPTPEVSRPPSPVNEGSSNNHVLTLAERLTVGEEPPSVASAQEEGSMVLVPTKSEGATGSDSFTIASARNNTEGFSEPDGASVEETASESDHGETVTIDRLGRPLDQIRKEFAERMAFGDSYCESEIGDTVDVESLENDIPRKVRFGAPPPSKQYKPRKQMPYRPRTAPCLPKKNAKNEFQIPRSGVPGELSGNGGACGRAHQAKSPRDKAGHLSPEKYFQLVSEMLHRENLSPVPPKKIGGTRPSPAGGRILREQRTDENSVPAVLGQTDVEDAAERGSLSKEEYMGARLYDENMGLFEGHRHYHHHHHHHHHHHVHQSPERTVSPQISMQEVRSEASAEMLTSHSLGGASPHTVTRTTTHSRHTNGSQSVSVADLGSVASKEPSTQFSMDSIPAARPRVGLVAEDATRTIQASYRGWKVRSELSKSNEAASKIQGFYKKKRTDSAGRTSSLDSASVASSAVGTSTEAPHRSKSRRKKRGKKYTIAKSLVQTQIDRANASKAGILMTSARQATPWKHWKYVVSVQLIPHTKLSKAGHLFRIGEETPNSMFQARREALFLEEMGYVLQKIVEDEDADIKEFSVLSLGKVFGKEEGSTMKRQIKADREKNSNTHRQRRMRRRNSVDTIMSLVGEVEKSNAMETNEQKMREWARMSFFRHADPVTGRASHISAQRVLVDLERPADRNAIKSLFGKDGGEDEEGRSVSFDKFFKWYMKTAPPVAPVRTSSTDNPLPVVSRKDHDKRGFNNTEVSDARPPGAKSVRWRDEDADVDDHAIDPASTSDQSVMRAQKVASERGVRNYFLSSDELYQVEWAMATKDPHKLPGTVLNDLMDNDPVYQSVARQLGPLPNNLKDYLHHDPVMLGRLHQRTPHLPPTQKNDDGVVHPASTGKQCDRVTDNQTKDSGSEPHALGPKQAIVDPHRAVPVTVHPNRNHGQAPQGKAAAWLYQLQCVVYEACNHVVRGIAQLSPSHARNVPEEPTFPYPILPNMLEPMQELDGHRRIVAGISLECHSMTTFRRLIPPGRLDEVLVSVSKPLTLLATQESDLRHTGIQVPGVSEFEVERKVDAVEMELRTLAISLRQVRETLVVRVGKIGKDPLPFYQPEHTLDSYKNRTANYMMPTQGPPVGGGSMAPTLGMNSRSVLYVNSPG